MDTRKLEVINGTGIYFQPEGTPPRSTPLVDSRHLGLNLYDREDIAAEMVRRWNSFHDLIRHMDGMLVQMEDGGTIIAESLKDARQLLTTLGYNEETLGQLADHHEETTPTT